MKAPLVVILMGSPADETHCQRIATVARDLGLEVVLHVGSAHKTPEHVLSLLRRYEADPRPKVYITVAGRSNALSGLTDGVVCVPVIACPTPTDALGGADIFSSLHMPSGIAPAVVLDPANAALLAAKIFGVSDPAIRARVAAFQKQNADRVLRADAERERRKDISAGGCL